MTGLYAAFGTMIALWERASSGKGQVIDATLAEAAFSFMEPFVPAYGKLGVVAKRSGSKLPGAAPNNLYATKDEEYIHIAAWHDTLFVKLCEVMHDNLQRKSWPRWEVISEGEINEFFRNKVIG